MLLYILTRCLECDTAERVYRYTVYIAMVGCWTALPVVVNVARVAIPVGLRLTVACGSTKVNGRAIRLGLIRL